MQPHRFARLTLLLCSTFASVAHGQQDVMTLPAPLVTALLDAARHTGSFERESAGSSTYFLDQLPPGWPATLTPSAPARLIGGRRMGPVTIAVFQDTAHKFLANYYQQLERSGYLQPTYAAGPGFGAGGGYYDFFCKDSMQVTANAVTGAAYGAFISVKIVRTPFPRCVAVAPELADFADRRRRPLELPPLVIPAGTDSRGSNQSGNASNVSGYTTLVSARPVAADILRHYVAQLNAGGWIAETPAASDHVAAVLLSAKDAAGQAWSGSLVVGVRGTQATVTLDMRPATEP